MVEENTLLETACHFLLLLVGFDTVTYRKDYDRSPILVGHHPVTEELSGLKQLIIQMTAAIFGKIHTLTHH